MKKILFPTDFSEVADNAYVYALHMAKDLDASIYALHTYKYPEIPANRLNATVDEFLKSVDQEESEGYQKKVARLDQIGMVENIEPSLNHLLVRRGVKDAILRTVLSESIDIIVMGTAGHDSFWKHFSSTKTAEIMENANCMTLCVPKNAKFDGKLDTIVFATDFSEQNQRALEKVLPLCQQLGAELHVINLDFTNAGIGEKRMEQFKKDFEDYDFLKFEVVEATNFNLALQKYAEANQVDFFIMQTKQRDFFEEFFTWSLTKELVYHINTPVLAIPDSILK